MNWIEYNTKYQSYFIMNMREGRCVDFHFETYAEAEVYCIEHGIKIEVSHV